MSAAVALPVVLPLVGAAVTVLLLSSPAWQRVVSLAVTLAVLGLGVGMLAGTADGDVLVTALAAWPAGVAIPLAADAFSALMISVAALVVVLSLVAAPSTSVERDGLFHPLVMLMTGGAYGVFLTADLFTLFVLIELMLVPSYALMVWRAGSREVGAGGVYVAINLLASTLLISGIALVYAVTGTVNLAELRVVAVGGGAAALAGAVVLVSLLGKSAVVPAHGWLPRTYPAAPPVVTVLFSALLTKAGVYAVFRIYAVMFEGDPVLRTPLLLLCAVTMVVGVLGAVGQSTIRDVLSFHMVSQMGYLLLGVALFGTVGTAAAIFYTVQYIVVKAGLFLVAVAVEARSGTGSLDRLGGMAARSPLLAAGFAICALSLAGLPPMSGFLGKFLLVRAAFLEAEYAVGVVAVAVSLLTLLSMAKLWNGVFWGGTPEAAPVEPSLTAASVRVATPAPPRRRSDVLLIAPVLAAAAVTLGLGLGGELLLALSEGAADGLLDPSGYVEAVLAP
jgi:multicomponent Na+:H+ antiporter subunit D